MCICPNLRFLSIFHSFCSNAMFLELSSKLFPRTKCRKSVACKSEPKNSKFFHKSLSRKNKSWKHANLEMKNTPKKGQSLKLMIFRRP